MANKEQLAILKQGVAAWNKWREENPDAKINLRWAKLDGLDLSGANFRKADILGASFKNNKLCLSNFTETTNGNSLRRIFFNLILLIIGLNLILFTSLVEYFVIDMLAPIIHGGDAIKYIIILFGCMPIFFSIKNQELSIILYAVISIILFLVSLNIMPKENNYRFVAIFSPYVLFVIYINHALIFIVPWLHEAVVCIVISCFVFMFFISSPYDLVFLFIFIRFLIFYSYCNLQVSRYGYLKNNFINWLFKTKLLFLTFSGTSFQESDLTGAIFDNAKIKYSRFGNTILTGTSFKGTHGLQLSRCNGTILEDRDVRELLVRGNGHGLLLKGKNLQGAHLVNADLRGLDLRETDLMQANLSGADITGAKLYGSARENWIIDGIRCDYIYWDEAGEQRTPPDRDFRPGEFEELYKQLPTFEYIFEQGFTPLDPLIMDRVVQAVNEQHKEFSLELVNFDKRGQPHATFTVCRLDYVEKAREQITAGYEASKGSPEQQAQLMAAVLGLIENQNKLIDKIPSSRELTMGDTYQIYGGQIGAIGQSASASGNIFQQITAELPRVHEEMRRSAASPEQKAAAEDVAKAAQAAQQQNEPAVRQHLKNAGKFALDCAQKIGAEALAEYLKKMTLGL